jgi:hypothetical protein
MCHSRDLLLGSQLDVMRKWLESTFREAYYPGRARVLDMEP